MPTSPLSDAVEAFAQAARWLPDAALVQGHLWRGQEADVRWSLFAVYTELCDLAATLAVDRGARGPALTVAHCAMADAQSALRDLQGLLLGAVNLDLDQPPAAGEWPLREVFRHLFRSASGFTAVLRWTIERARNGDAPAQTPDDVEWNRRGDLDSSGDLGALVGRLVAQHDAAVAEFAGLTEAELATPFLWWFTAEVRFQLFRFDAHLREHTLQIAKLLEALVPPPSDALRTLRLVYGALAKAEGCLIGAPALGATPLAAATARIQVMTASLAAAPGQGVVGA